MAAEVTKARGAALPYLLSLPALLFIGLFFLLPVASLFFTSVLVRGDDGGWSIDPAIYVKLTSDAYTLGILWRTVRLSLLSTLLSILLAFPVALYMRQLSQRWQTIIAFALLSPLLTSVVVRTLAWIILLGPKGMLNSALVSLGLSPVALIYNETGVVIGLVHVFFGYMVLCLMTSILKLDEDLLRAASNLGAGPWTVLRTIILPLSLPGLLAGSVLVFTMSASTYATPVLLGGNGSKLLAVEVYDLAITHLDWPEASAVAVILFALIAVLVLGTTRIVESGLRRVIFR